MLLLNQYSRYSLLVVAMLTQACQMTPVVKEQPVTSKQPVVDPVIMKHYAGALDLMRSGHDEAAIKIFKDLIIQDDQFSGPYSNLGLLYLKQGDSAQAKSSFEKALKRNPENVTALNQLAIMSRNEGDFKEAKDRYETALSINPEHINAHINLGILCDTYLQDLSCALEHFEQYQTLNGEDPMVKNWIIDLKERM